VSEPCDIPPKPGQQRHLRGTPRGTTLLREVVDRNCVGRIRCASARVSGINFQACSLTTRTPLRYLLRGSSSSGASVAARDTRDTPDTFSHNADLNAKPSVSDFLRSVEEYYDLTSGADPVNQPSHRRAVAPSVPGHRRAVRTLIGRELRNRNSIGGKRDD
jgi:hypothetical protein